MEGRPSLSKKKERRSQEMENGEIDLVVTFGKATKGGVAIISLQDPPGGHTDWALSDDDSYQWSLRCIAPLLSLSPNNQYRAKPAVVSMAIGFFTPSASKPPASRTGEAGEEETVVRVTLTERELQRWRTSPAARLQSPSLASTAAATATVNSNDSNEFALVVTCWKFKFVPSCCTANATTATSMAAIDVDGSDSGEAMVRDSLEAIISLIRLGGSRREDDSRGILWHIEHPWRVCHRRGRGRGEKTDSGGGGGVCQQCRLAVAALTSSSMSHRTTKAAIRSIAAHHTKARFAGGGGGVAASSSGKKRGRTPSSSKAATATAQKRTPSAKSSSPSPSSTAAVAGATAPAVVEHMALDLTRQQQEEAEKDDDRILPPIKRMMTTMSIAASDSDDEEEDEDIEEDEADNDNVEGERDERIEEDEEDEQEQEEEEDGEEGDGEEGDEEGEKGDGVGHSAENYVPSSALADCDEEEEEEEGEDDDDEEEEEDEL